MASTNWPPILNGGGGGGSGANTTLSNLTSPTAVNQDLLPATEYSNNLGTSGNEWNEVYANDFVAGSSITNATLTNALLSVAGIVSYDVLSFATTTLFIGGASDSDITNAAGETHIEAKGGVVINTTQTGGAVVLQVNQSNDAALTLSSNNLNLSGLLAGAGTRFQLQDGNNGKFIGIKANDTMAADYTVSMPAAQGGANTFLQNDGSGNLSWAAGTYSAPSAQLMVDTPSGYGSAASNKVRTFSNVVINNGGSDITYTSDAVNGDKFTINTTGTYALEYADGNTAGQAWYGFTKNSTHLTTNLFSIARPEFLAGEAANAGSTAGFATAVLNIIVKLTATDVIRGQIDSTITTPNSTDKSCYIKITRLS